MSMSLLKRSIRVRTRICVMLFIAALVFSPLGRVQASNTDAPSIRSDPSSAGQPKSSPESSAENSFAADTVVPNTPTLVSPTNGASGVSTSPALKVTLSDPNSASLTATFYGRQAPGSGPADFTVIALPDTQKYSSLNNGIFNIQTQWIVDNRTSLNIAFVTHLGDIVDDWNVPYEWDVANAALTKLDNNGIPYGLTLGNCDENGYGSNPAGSDLFNNYFPASRYQGRSYYGGAYNGDNHNSYQLFSAGGLDFIIIHLQYYDPNPDPAMITWAHNLLQTYSSRRGILVTHFITDTSDNFGAQSSAIYQALKDRPNLFLMLGGHLMVEGRRQDPGTDGHIINSLRADFQEPYGNTNPLWANGGNGWLRIMRFSPTDNKIYVQTYSPSLNQYLTDAQSQFTLDYNMGGSSFQPIGTVANVASGSTASLTWQNLTPGTQYQWYVSTNNGTSTTVGPTWSFTPGSAGTPPAITTQPVSQTVNAGQTATYTAAATGSPAPTVQWQVSSNGGGTWTDLSGAASTTYSFTAQAADNGKQYHAVFTNPAGSATSSAAVLIVYYAPAFTSAASTQFTVGSPGSFTVAASGNPAPTLAVSGALPTGVQFNPSSGVLSGTPAAGTGGVYALTFSATNTAGTANQSFTLTVNQPPAVTQQPANQSVNAGQTASFTATASGYPAPAVQWQVSADSGATWANVSGAISPTYSFTSQPTDDGKQFRAVFTNSAGSITSGAATLSVASAPVITTQPASQTVTAGGTASFSAAASGSPSPAVQWQLSTDNGSSWGNIGSATTTTYAFTAQVSDSGKQYRAVFTNSAGSATTDAARLTVNVPPAFTSGSSTTLQVGASGSFTVTASGTPTPALTESGALPTGITFTDNGNGTATLGGTPASGTGKTYTLTITAANAAGTATQNFTLTVNQAPGVTAQPANQSVNAGQPVSFTAAASGYPTPTAQWQDSTNYGSTWSNIPGATSTTYSFTPEAADNSKQFRVIFTNSTGSATTNAAILTVTWAPVITEQPANLVVTAGQTASFSAAATGSPTPTTQWQVSADSGATWANISDATATTYSFTAQTTDNGKQFRAAFTNSAGTTTTNAAALSVNGVPVIVTEPADLTLTAGGTASFTATAAGNPTPTVQWQVSTDNGSAWTAISGATSPTYSFTAQLSDSGKQFRAVFTNPAGSATSNTARLTVYVPPVITSPSSTTFQVGASGSFTVTASGSPTPALTESGALPTGITFTDNGNGTATLGGIPTAGTGGVYSLTLTAANAANTANQNFTLTVNQALAITTQPLSQSVNANQPVSFTAAASGYPSPTVQWQSSTDNGATWANISGATSTTYSFTAQIADNGRQFHAVFTNSLGGATSNAAALTVTWAPVITTQPVNQTVPPGGTAAFTAAASGSPAPTAQWQVSTDNGSTWTNISGATSAAYSFTAQSGDNGKQFRAVFTNPAGSANSDAAVLSITDLIFADGFSICNASAWLGPNSTTLPTISTTAGYSGCGMAAAFNTSPSAVYLTDPSPNSESVYKARFYFNPNTMKLSKNDTVTIFTASQGSSTPVLAVQIHSNNGKSLIIRAGATNDSGVWTYTTWTNLAVKWQAVEVDWQASSSATANNGSLQFLLSGAQAGSLANLNNDARRVDTVSLGIVSGMTRTTTGTGYFDEFISRRYTPIGIGTAGISLNKQQVFLPLTVNP